jgi:hypothetical protein
MTIERRRKLEQLQEALITVSLDFDEKGYSWRKDIYTCLLCRSWQGSLSCHPTIPLVSLSSVKQLLALKP